MWAIEIPRLAEPERSRWGDGGDGFVEKKVHRNLSCNMKSDGSFSVDLQGSIQVADLLSTPRS